MYAPRRMKEGSWGARGESERSEAEERFMWMFHRAPVGMIITDPKTTDILAVNEEFEKITGYSRQEAVGSTVIGLGLWVEPRARREKIAEALASEGLFSFEEPFRKKSGALVPLRVSGRLIESEGKVYALAAFVDLTEEKRTQAERRALEEQLCQAQKMEAIGRFAAGIAHDVNNVLAAITMSTDLLRSQLGPAAPQSELADEIRTAVGSALSLTGQLLAFSRQQRQKPVILDLNELLAGLEAKLRGSLGEKVVLDVRPSPQLGAVRADGGQIQQVLLNLAINGRDAMQRGGTLTIETFDVDHEAPVELTTGALAAGPYVAVVVSDTGVGMDPAMTLRVFEPFFTTNRFGKGTGLGLSTVYGIVQQSGGAIDVESEVGKGTSFRVLLPRVPPKT